MNLWKQQMDALKREGYKRIGKQDEQTQPAKKQPKKKVKERAK